LLGNFDQEGCMRPKMTAGLLAGVVLGLCVLVSLNVNVAQADNLYGSIRGTVTDQSGAGVPGVAVTATNTATGVSQQVITSNDGSYNFLQLAIGDYSVKAEKTGFQTFTATRVHLDVNTVYVQDVKLTVGTVSQEVTVQANQVQVETSTPQLGTVIDANQIVNMPLIGRDFVYLQQLEPGVMAASDRFGNNGDTAPAFSTNGAETQMNVFLIDGTDTGDIALNQPSFLPSPDAIAEFRMVTSVLNPEYARSSGAILNAVIKSGTNSFHGDVFDFYRDAALLDSANYFAVPHLPSDYQQNLFGGTVGGPVIKNHTFFFFSFQGLHAGQPQTNPIGPNIVTNVYTDAQRTGAFGAAAFAGATNTSPFPLWGDPCPTSGPKCAAGTPFSTLFASGNIPTQDFNPLAVTLLNKYVPTANLAGDKFSFNASQPTTDYQYILRIDQNFGARDTLWGTYFQEGYNNTATVPFNGANLPGFGMTNQQHWKYLTLSWTHIFNDHLLNEFRLGWARYNYHSVFPTTPTLPSSLGFDITPQDPSGAGVPYIGVTGLFTLGFSDFGPQPRIDSNYQGVDNLQLVKGRHTLKFGVDIRRFYYNNPFFGAFNSGYYSFAPTGAFSTGNAGADFLLGIPAFYLQGSGAALNAYANQYYTYVQDEFKLRPNLTVIFGTSWVVDSPFLDISNNGHAQVAWRPGVQSTLFPGAPLGVVYQGDPGVNAGGRTRYGQFGPRLGFAWSPDAGWLTGGPGKTSVRAGFGIYYDRSEGEQDLQTLGLPPFAISTALGAPTGSTVNPGFATPYTDLVTGAATPNPYPFKGVPSTVDFLTTPGFTPLWSACCAALGADTRDPAAYNYNFTIERQLSSSTILTLGYVGSQSRYLTYGLPVNAPTDAAGDTPYPIGVYGSIDQLYSGGNANYNSFQAEVNQHLSHRLQYLASYTYSHSIDDTSSFENSTFGGIGGGNNGYGGYGAVRASNPYCFPACDRASSIFDARQRLVISYFYELPGVGGSTWMSRLTKGWTISGITTFQTGFPLDVYDSSFPGGGYAPISGVSDFTSWEGPNQVAPVTYFNPRTGGANQWFSPSSFAQVVCAPSCAAAGVPPSSVEAYGDAPRNLMRGPGINNWDFQLYKDTQITESTRVELRMEMYNVFNHTQFNPLNVVTDINNPAFGQVLGAYNPRRVQLAAKFYF
jgi:Carboxypeptidase regulatory-like domain